MFDIAAMMTSNLSACSAGIMPSQELSTNSGFTPMSSAMALATSVSQPSASPAGFLNVYGLYCRNVPTRSLPDFRISLSRLPPGGTAASALEGPIIDTAANAGAASVKRLRRDTPSCSAGSERSEGRCEPVCSIVFPSFWPPGPFPKRSETSSPTLRPPPGLNRTHGTPLSMWLTPPGFAPRRTACVRSPGTRTGPPSGSPR